MNLRQHVESFFSQKKLTSPLLLALSGGPDSLALFYLLLEVKVKFSVAHVDHGWRPESKEEAVTLSDLSASMGISFHQCTLKKCSEEAARKERLKFFKALKEQYGYQATLLGHHSGDFSETVLKKVFEGAYFATGIAKETHVEGVTLWRPLIGVSKQEILSYLERKGVAPFYDRTNEDPNYLRGRMRTEIFPFLSQLFGKNLQGSLVKLGEQQQLAQDFMASYLKPYLSQVERGPFGSWLAVDPQLHPFAKRTLIRTFGLLHKIPLSRSEIETIEQLLLKNASNKSVSKLKIDRGRLFYFREIEARWKIEVIEAVDIYPESRSWQALWRGEAMVVVPQGNYELLSSKCLNKSGLKRRTAAKIPLFFRSKIPLLIKDKKIYFDFLAGGQHSLDSQQPTMLLRILNENDIYGIV